MTVTRIPETDANGNILLWLDTSGAIAARQEPERSGDGQPTGLPEGRRSRQYGPFGEPLMREGWSASPFAFSTKYLDKETGLYYYGRRYYRPETGRWLNRDPMEENWAAGEFNVYAFVSNNPMTWIDVLGFEKKPSDNNFINKEERKQFWFRHVSQNQANRHRYQELKKSKGDLGALNQLKKELSTPEGVAAIRKAEQSRIAANRCNKCECGSVEIRPNRPIFENTNAKDLANDKWYPVSNDPNSPTSIDPQVSGRWELRIRGGTCTSYKFQVKETIHPEDYDYLVQTKNRDGKLLHEDLLNFNSGIIDYYNGIDPKVAAISNTFGMNTNQHMGRPFAENPYVSPIPQKGKRTTLFLISITGFINGEQGCNSKFWIK